MDTAKMARLAQAMRYGTTYEVVLEMPTGERFRVGYTPRRSRLGLLAAMRNRGRELLVAVGAPEDATVKPIAGPAFQFENGATVRFSGRTARDAILGGELPRLPKVGGEMACNNS
jgi:hypothetical protein